MSPRGKATSVSLSLTRTARRGAEDLAGGQLGDVGEGSDDVAEVIAGSRVDVRRVRGILRFLSPCQRGAHRHEHQQYATGIPRADHRRERAMEVNLLC